MTPIAGLNEPAEAEAFASGGGVAGPIGQGSRGGVPIVKPDAAGVGSASETVISGAGGDVMVTTSSGRLLGGGRISADTSGTGTGGNVDVTSDSLVISGLTGTRALFARSSR